VLAANDGVSHVSRLERYWRWVHWEKPLTQNAAFGEYLLSSDFGKRDLDSLMCRTAVD